MNGSHHLTTVATLTYTYVLAIVVPVLLELGHPLLALGTIMAAILGISGRSPVTLTQSLGALALSQLCFLAVDWQRADNHQYLVLYWLVAMSAASYAPERLRVEVVRTSARWLMGLTMGIAGLWKLASQQFTDGDFLFLAFLTDPRFTLIGRAFGDPLTAARTNNRAAIQRLLEDPALRDVSLQGGPLGVFRLAHAMSWFVIALELILAALLLAPNGTARAAKLRHPLLLAFIFGTYALAPVPGFGLLLCLLGYASTTDSQSLVRLAFAIASGFVGVSGALSLL